MTRHKLSPEHLAALEPFIDLLAEIAVDNYLRNLGEENKNGRLKMTDAETKSHKASKLLTTAEAAEYLKVSKAFLERDRWAGARIPFVRIGYRAVRYEVSALEAFVQSRIQKFTSTI